MSETGEKILEMLEAIKEGRETITELGHSQNDIQIRFTSAGVFFESANGSNEVEDTDFARQIGAALIMWANVKDGWTFSADDIFNLTKLLGWTNSKPENHTVNQSRAEWYERNIPFMTLETMKRNWEDLKKIERDYATNGEGIDTHLLDCRRAMDYLWHAMKEKDPNIKQCKKCYFIDGDPHFCK